MKAESLIRQISQVLGSDELLKGRYTEDIAWMEKRLELWKKQQIRLGVIGVTSSGKSTLLNAVLGEVILSTAVAPSSSQIVSCSKGAERKVTVYFTDGKISDLRGDAVSLEAIRGYSDENFNRNNKKGVAQLEIFTPLFAFPQDTVLIDSPGLDAYGLERHERLTLETLLPTLDMCIFITTVKPNSDAKTRSFLQLIKKYRCPVILVQNMIDSLKPTYDGQKDVKQVAEEHRGRLLKVVKAANLEEGTYRICQISADKSLKARLSKGTNAKLGLRHWGFNNFVSVVDRMVNEKRPDVENRRIETLLSRVRQIIEDDKPITSSDFQVKPFALEGLYEKVDKRFESASSTVRKLNDSIDYEEILEKLFDAKSDKKSSKKASYDISSIISTAASALGRYKETDNKKDNEIKKMEKSLFDSETKAKKNLKLFIDDIRSVEKKISDTILGLNEYLSAVIRDELKESVRDLTSFAGVEGLSVPSIRKRTEARTVMVKKSGFIGGAQRFFGFIFGNDDWGYEEETTLEQVYDMEDTCKALREYVKRAGESYGRTIEKWERTSLSTIRNIEKSIEMERRSYESKLPRTHDNEIQSEEYINAVKNVTQSLERIISEISPDVDCAAKVNADKNGLEIDQNDSEVLRKEYTDIEVKAMTVDYMHLEKQYRRAIYRNTVRAVYDRFKVNNRNDIIVSWDSGSAAAFLDMFYAEDPKKITVENEKLVTKTDSYLWFNDIRSKAEFQKHWQPEGKNIYILMNTTQIGAAEKELMECGILQLMSKDDFLVLVVQDFQEIMNSNNGESVGEAAIQMLELRERCSAGTKGVVMLNHSNPIYNLAFVQFQMSEQKNQSTEIGIIADLAAAFPWIDSECKEITGKLLRGRIS